MDYNPEDLEVMDHELSENFFIDIVKLAKSKPTSMIYAEFETNQVYHDDYRHYAFLYGEKAIDRLPRILRLPEDRTRFNTEALADDLFEDVFKQHANIAQERIYILNYGTKDILLIQSIISISNSF